MILVSYGMQVLGGILGLIAYFGIDVLLGDAGFDLSQRGSIAFVLLAYSGPVLMLGGHVTKFSAFRYTTLQRSPVDMSSKRPKPRSKALEILQAFEKLGFKRLGETHEKRPGTTDDEGTAWNMANPNGTILLEVVQIKDFAMCQLTTVFADQAVVESSLPKGSKIDKSNYYSRFTTKNAQTLYKEHVAFARELVKKHGKPRSIMTISDLLQWESIHMERYAKYKAGNFASEEVIYSAIIVLAPLVVFIIDAL